MKIRVLADSIDVSDMLKPPHGQPLDDFVIQFNQTIANIKGMMGAEVISTKLRVEHYGYDGAYTVELDTYRWETDDEYQRRLEKEQVRQERLERKRLAALDKKYGNQASIEHDLAEYNQLKAKYGE